MKRFFCAILMVLWSVSILAMGDGYDVQSNDYEDVRYYLKAELAVYELSVAGSVVGSGYYGHNEEAVIAAVAKEGFHFTRWTDGETSNPRRVNVVSDTQFYALFTLNGVEDLELSSSIDTMRDCIFFYVESDTVGCDSMTWYLNWFDNGILMATIYEKLYIPDTLNYKDGSTYHAWIFNGICAGMNRLNYTLYRSSDEYVEVESCNNYEWHGNVYDEINNIGVYNDTNEHGCGHTEHIHLSVLKPLKVFFHDNYSNDTIHSLSYCPTSRERDEGTFVLQIPDLSLVRKGYTFLGWSIDSMAETEVYNNEIELDIDSNAINIDLYAIWSLNCRDTTIVDSIVACDEYTWAATGITYNQSCYQSVTLYNYDVDPCVNTRELYLIIYNSERIDFEVNTNSAYYFRGNSYAMSGDYNIVLPAMDDGCDTIYLLHLVIDDIVSEIKNVDNVSQLSVYPSPTSSKIYIDIDCLKEIELYDLMGNCLRIFSSSPIDIAGYPAGIYMLRIITTHSSYLHKITKR